MKVIVRCANNRVTKADMEREIERLFQENKDLRLSESHLKDDLAKSESESAQGMNAVVKFWEEAVKEKNKAKERAEEYCIAAMESDCRVNELEKQLEWARNKNDEWAAVAQGLRNTIEELKAQKEADDKKSEEICAACNERYEDVLAERNRLREEVARLTTERDTSVSENSELIFTINELQDKLEVERNLRANAEKERDMYRSSAEAWHAEHDKVVADVALYREKARKYLDERNRAWDTNRRLEGNEETITYYQEIAEKRKEKLDEAMRTITSLNDDIHELEETIDGLNEDKRTYGEEIDRLRKVVIELQTNRFTTDEFIGMIMKNFMPSADK